MNQHQIDGVLYKTLKNKLVFGAVACVASGDGESLWLSAAGNLNIDDQYFIASTTKLYTTAIVFRLCAEGRMHLDDALTKFFTDELLEGVHVCKGQDYSNAITVRQLLSQTSGIADYFLCKRPGGSLENQIVSGRDVGWTFEEVIHDVKTLPAAFPPGTKGKALYSDTNYQLLGKIIEIVTGEKYVDVLHRFIIQQLGLTKTYLYCDTNDNRPASLNYKSSPLHIPQAMSSFGPDGGIVSTASESIIFLKAFFNGDLFPKTILDDVATWNRIFFPLQYGLGMMRFQLPRVFTGFRLLPELIGHSGLSGAFAFYCPSRDLYFTGTVNQVANPGICFKMLMQLMLAALDKKT